MVIKEPPSRPDAVDRLVSNSLLPSIIYKCIFMGVFDRLLIFDYNIKTNTL